MDPALHSRLGLPDYMLSWHASEAVRAWPVDVPDKYAILSELITTDTMAEDEDRAPAGWLSPAHWACVVRLHRQLDDERCNDPAKYLQTLERLRRYRVLVCIKCQLIESAQDGRETYAAAHGALVLCGVEHSAEWLKYIETYREDML